MKTLLTIILFTIVMFVVSCSGGSGGGKSTVDSGYAYLFDGKIVGVNVSTDELTITGLKLEQVESVKIQVAGVVHDLNFESNNSIIKARLIKGLSLAINETFTVIIGNAHGNTLVEAVFTVKDGEITTSKIADGAVKLNKLDGALSGQGLSTGQILTWNGTAWIPSSPNSSQLYLGGFDATTGLPSLTASHNTGEYYLVQVGGVFDLGAGPITLDIGDTLISDGVNFTRIPNSNAISSVFGRTGLIVSQANDYTWNQIDKTISSIGDIADVDLTTVTPLNGNVLSFNGSKFVPTLVTDNGIADESLSKTKINGLQSKLNSIDVLLTSIGTGKQGTITTGTSAQYFQGDLALATLDTSVVPENGNLYFTDTRVLTAINGASIGGITLPSALGTTIANIPLPVLDGDAVNKKYVDDTATSINTSISSLTTNEIAEGTSLYFTDARAVSALSASLNNKLNITGGTISGSLKIDSTLSLQDSTANTVGIKSPATVNTSYVLTLPPDAGTSGQVLITDNSGNLTWSTPTTSVNDSNIADGAISIAKISGLSTSLSGKADTTNLTQIISALSITGLAAPTSGSEAANKTYVDTKEPLITTGTASQYLKGNKTLGTFSTDVNALQYWNKTANAYTMTLPSSQLTAKLGTGFTAAQGGGNGFYTAVDGYSGNSFVQDVIDSAIMTTSLNNIVMRSAHGTTGALTAIQSGEVIGTIMAKAHDGVSASQFTASDTNSKIEFKAIENQSASAKGTSLAMYITNSATTVLVKALEIVGVSTNTNGASVRIAGKSSGAASQDIYSVSNNDMKASLDVNGSAITRTYTYASGSIFDLSKSNSIAVTAPTGTSGAQSYTLNNIADGGVYSLAFQDSSSTVNPSFTITKAEDGTTIAGANIRYNPSLAARTSAKHAIFTVARVGSFVYVTWMEF